MAFRKLCILLFSCFYWEVRIGIKSTAHSPLLSLSSRFSIALEPPPHHFVLSTDVKHGYCFSYFLLISIFSSRRRHTRFDCDWSSDVCSSDLDHGTAHHHHAPELGVNGEHQKHAHGSSHHDDALEDGRHAALEHAEGGSEHHAGDQGIHHFGGDGTQHRVERREVPHWGDVRRRHQRVGLDEVVVLQEVATGFRGEEDHRGESHQ